MLVARLSASRLRRHLTELIRQVSGLEPFFRGLTRVAAYFDTPASNSDKIQELLELVAWCALEGNRPGTVASKLSAVSYFHRANLQMELPTSSPLGKRALKEGHGRTLPPVPHINILRHPISWDTLLGGQGLSVSWGPGGRVHWLSLTLGCFFYGEVRANYSLLCPELYTPRVA